MEQTVNTTYMCWRFNVCNAWFRNVVMENCFCLFFFSYQIKSAAYLKEQPQATPLIPSSTTISPANHNEPILAMIFQNPYILTFIVALILLIIVLLIILMLVGGSKHQPHQTNRKG